MSNAIRRSQTRRLMLVFVTLAFDGCTTPEPEILQPPGNRDMAARLELLATNARPRNNVYLNEARADLFAAEPLPKNPTVRLRATWSRAREELRAGRIEAAIERLETALMSPTVARPMERQLRSLLALCYLRLGEQENCVDRHTSASCLLPITAEGIHRNQQASQRAVDELTVLLNDQPDDLDARWLLNIAAMTLGNYPDGVPSEWLVPPDAFASEGHLDAFPDVSVRASVATFGLAGGAVVEDLDGDGALDILATSWGLRDPIRYFRNRATAELAFDDQTDSAGLAGLGGGLNVVHADYDNDGRTDVFVLRGAWLGREGRHPNSLLRNVGGRFEDVTEAAGLLSFHPTQTAAWGDFDNDGWLDLMIGNESQIGDRHPCELYRNNGDGTFTNVAKQTGIAFDGYVKAVVWGDFDNDGWLDLYLSRMLEPNLLLRNEPRPDGGRRFRDVTTEAGVAEPLYSFPAWFFDYDNDGWLDLFAAGYDPQYLAAGATNVAADYLGSGSVAATPRLYRNKGDGTFSDETMAAGLDRVLYAMGSNFGDLDNDGWLDFYLGTGAPDLRAIVPNRMFRNRGDGRFADVTTVGGFGHIQKGHGVAFGDLDQDGDQDLYAVLGGAYSGDGYMNALFQNPGSDNRWITIDLEGVRQNRSAIGVRLRLTVETPNGPRDIHATVSTGGSFGSSSLRQEVGLGEATALTALEVWWPSSDARQRFTDVVMDHAYVLREGDDLEAAPWVRP